MYNNVHKGRMFEPLITHKKTMYEEINQNPEPIWSAERLATFMGINRKTVYRWIKAGKIKALGISGCHRIPMSEVQRITKETREKLISS